jgi:hypothetical protein
MVTRAHHTLAATTVRDFVCRELGAEAVATCRHPLAARGHGAAPCRNGLLTRSRLLESASMELNAQAFLAALEQRLRRELQAFVAIRRHNVTAGAERAMLASLVTEQFGEGLATALECSADLLGSPAAALDREIDQYALELDAMEMRSKTDARLPNQDERGARMID